MIEKKEKVSPPLLFSVLALGLSWTYWLAIIASQHSWIRARVPLTPFGAFGPALAAVIVSAALRGRRGVSELLRGLVTKPPWRIFAIGLAAWPCFVLLALLFAALRGLPLVPIGTFPLARLPLVILEIFLFTAVAEELGWRGFLLPSLLTRLHPAAAALVVGALWALWHLPLFFIPGTSQASIPFGFFAVHVLAASFVYTSVYLRSRASLLPSVGLHTFQDASLALAPVLWPVAGNSGVFWYAYFAIVLAAGLAFAAGLVLRAEFK